jgi:3-hydroxyisobutyrate dehydrogenase
MHYGYIGLGNLGGHLAASLLQAGHRVTVFDRNPALAERHAALGATVAPSVSAMAEQVDHVFTCLPNPAVSEAVLAELMTGLKPAPPGSRTPPLAATMCCGSRVLPGSERCACWRRR